MNKIIINEAHDLYGCWEIYPMDKTYCYEGYCILKMVRNERYIINRNNRTKNMRGSNEKYHFEQVN